jgi:hypothetical protein
MWTYGVALEGINGEIGRRRAGEYVCSGQGSVIAKRGHDARWRVPRYGTDVRAHPAPGVQLWGPRLAVALNQQSLYGTVRTTGPSSVTAMVCSLCAARLPVAVRRAHPSGSVT